MEDETYNGYTNYETWKLCLNLDNDESLYNEYKDYDRDYTQLKESLESIFEVDNGYKISYDFWSYNEWKEIDWIEVLETRKEE